MYPGSMQEADFVKACRPNWGHLFQTVQTVEECRSQSNVVPVQGQLPRLVNHLSSLSLT